MLERDGTSSGTCPVTDFSPTCVKFEDLLTAKVCLRYHEGNQIFTKTGSQKICLQTYF
jgi:hypothetical protein